MADLRLVSHEENSVPFIHIMRRGKVKKRYFGLDQKTVMVPYT